MMGLPDEAPDMLKVGFVGPGERLGDDLRGSRGQFNRFRLRLLQYPDNPSRAKALAAFNEAEKHAEDALVNDFKDKL
jgi:hypothetical protein